MNYAARRAQLAEKIGEGAALVLVAPPERVRSRDTTYPYRQHSDLLYLTGFAEPGTVAVFAPGHADHAFTMFVRKRDKAREIWDGLRKGPEGAIAEFGADNAYPLDELDERIGDIIGGRERLYYQLGADSAFDGRVLHWLAVLRSKRRLARRAPEAIVNPRRLLGDMRLIKDADELEVMARAGKLTAIAHKEGMQQTHPGMMEYALQGVIESSFVRQGGRWPAYGSIVAGGNNACILHYVENDHALRDGDLVLVDAGAEHDWYAADITRTWPVGKSFTGAQRDLYQAVLDSQIAAIDMVRPGISNHEINEATIRMLSQSMLDLKLLTGSLDEVIETEAYKKYYMHGTGHYIGLDVHDVGTYYIEDDVGLPFEPGIVVTIEPGLYVHADDESVPAAFRGNGIRIEDDVVVTDGDPWILTSDVPKTIADIEGVRRG